MFAHGSLFVVFCCAPDISLILPVVQGDTTGKFCGTCHLETEWKSCPPWPNPTCAGQGFQVDPNCDLLISIFVFTQLWQPAVKRAHSSLSYPFIPALSLFLSLHCPLVQISAGMFTTEWVEYSMRINHRWDDSQECGTLLLGELEISTPWRVSAISQEGGRRMHSGNAATLKEYSLC